jgi:hypothetical protein
LHISRSSHRRVLVLSVWLALLATLVLAPFAAASVLHNPLWIAVPVFITLGYVAVREAPRCLAYYRSLWPTAWLPALGTALIALIVTSGSMVLLGILPEWCQMNWSLGALFSVGGDAGMNGFSIPFTNPIFAILYAPAAFLALPLLAWVEEDVFRRGTTNLRSAIRRSTAFGLMHITAGVTVGASIALGLAGFVFTVVYWRALKSPEVEAERARLPWWAAQRVLPQRTSGTSAQQFAVYRSTQAHVVYNVVGILAILLFSVLPLGGN